METFLLFAALAASAAVAAIGIKTKNRLPIFAGAALAAVSVVFFGFLDFWIERLWFEAAGFDHRFWTVVLTKAGAAVGGAAAGWAVVAGLTFPVPREKWPFRIASRALGALVAGAFCLANWDTILVFAHQVRTGVSDPVLSRDTGFYLFTLPLLDFAAALMFRLAAISLGTIFVSLFVRFSGAGVEMIESAPAGKNTRQMTAMLYIDAALVAFALAAERLLARYHLLFSDLGTVSGPGWTDVNVRMPALTVVACAIFAVGALLLVPRVRSAVRGLYRRLTPRPTVSTLVPLYAAAGLIAAVWIIALGALPMAFQWFLVEPNEITYEKPYIAHNIDFTRKGFNLGGIEEREFPVSNRFSQKTVENNRILFNNIRLWDWRALDAVYQQFQEIRLYYEFQDVDIDRYHIGGKYRQVMVSAREMQIDNLPAQSQTFVNRRFKYTHGYGITLTPVNEFTEEGLPDLWVKDIPPKWRYPSLEVKQPRIYYGELTDTHVIVNSAEKEFDYPRGDDNAYTRYQGSGGVAIDGLWRKFLFSTRFDGSELLFSGYPQHGSRILFHRQILERVRHLAPFLNFDQDPYIVLADGRLYWIVDAYTTSANYPYSARFSASQYTRTAANDPEMLRQMAQFDGNNYVRNSVKAVVDAYNGQVDFYVFDPKDPIVRTWRRVFPGLFKDRGQMPRAIARHVRYPTDMLLIQGLVYAKYHMTDPAVFYNQEDLWVRATEKYYNRVQPIRPYYIMWKRPGSTDPEFVLILPFTPKNRQVLIGWIAGMCDGENYGRLLAYKFPKDKRVLGPQQVETKIDQDRFLSGQLTLWDQRGSNVIRGNVLAIPVAKTLVYVEPIYLRAETAAYPELRLVVMMHNDRLSYGDNLAEALKGLLAKKAEAEAGEKVQATASGPRQGIEALIRQADQAFQQYLRFMGEKKFKEASAALDRLQKRLESLKEKSAP